MPKLNYFISYYLMNAWLTFVARVSLAVLFFLTFFSLAFVNFTFASESQTKIPLNTAILSGAPKNAVSVYDEYQSSVFQIRIIERGSGSQASLGSAFLVALPEEASNPSDTSKTQTLGLATNFHVISSSFFEPEKYTIELAAPVSVVSVAPVAYEQKEPVQDKEPIQDIEKATRVIAQLAAVDVINDLAILQLDHQDQERFSELMPFQVSASLPSNGEVLYSLGNPHNIGLTVVEGNYNGLVEHRFNPQIHFSGAVNSGMSGGPVVNSQGQVVGINVATAGNQVGFLVPVAALKQLLPSVTNSFSLTAKEPIREPVEESTKFDQVKQTGKNEGEIAQQNTRLKSSERLSKLAEQIGAHTSAMIDAALAEPWEVSSMGQATVKSSPVDWLDCWGDSQREKDQKLYKISRGCHSGSSVYLARGFNSGFIEYEYFYFEAPTWPEISVYRALARETGRAIPANVGPTEQLGHYRCEHSQVENQAGLKARISFCLRPYKKLAPLFDVFFMAVSVDKEQQAIMSHYTLAGVTEQASEKFLQHFIEAIAWKP